MAGRKPNEPIPGERHCMLTFVETAGREPSSKFGDRQKSEERNDGMKTIIGNVFYDTDMCEMVAMRESGRGMHEYLLRSQNGQLLLAESISATCLGRLPKIGDVAIDNKGRKVVVCGTSSDGSCRVRSSQGEGTWDVPRGGLSSCNVYFCRIRPFEPGEPCDGFIVEECTWKRLVELGLITRGDKL